jgi:hypothetical protein
VGVDLGYAYLNQRRAGTYAVECVKQVVREGGGGELLSNLSDKAGEFIGNRMCLPTSSSMGINLVVGRRVIGDDDLDTCLRVGDIYGILGKFHGRNLPSLVKYNLDGGWYFCTSGFDLYHHSVVAFSEGLGVPATSVIGFESIRSFEGMLKVGGITVVSLDNSFVNDHNPFARQLLNPGRHAVVILNLEDDKVTLMDPYGPIEHVSVLKLQLPVEQVDSYLNYFDGSVTRGVLFAADRDVFSEWKGSFANLYVPTEVIDAVKEKTGGQII